MKRTTSALPSSRVVTLRILSILAIIVVIGRLFQVSVIEHSAAVASAENQYTVKQKVQAKRGRIYLRNLNTGENYPVAMNIDSYNVIADPFLIKENSATAVALAPALEMEATEIESKLTDKKKRYVVIKKKLNKDKSDEITKLKLKGITLEEVPLRYYPEGSLASQVVGFVNGEGEGQYGIESFFDEDLKGYDGALVGQKDAKRRIIDETDIAKPRDGADIVLTIDQNLQYMVEKKLKESMKKFEADGGSVVIMDVKSGAVLAMASAPDFNLNEYQNVPSDNQGVYVNHAISSPYESGSVFKSITLAAGMDMGLFEPSTRLDLPCSVTVDGYPIHNSEQKCYNHPDVTEVLTESINMGTIWAADQLGNDNFAKYIADFGFGSKTGIELQPEATGKVLDVKKWQSVHRATFSFGQGLTVTPLQLAAAYAAIANGGKLMKPYIVAKRVLSDGKEIVTQPKEVRQVIKPETAGKTNELLEQTVIRGHAKKAGFPGYKVAGKTGTAQVVGDDGHYEVDQNIGSLAGYFPSNDPKFAMVVKLDRPKAVEFAESSAAPTFGDIGQFLAHYAKIAPTP